MEAAFLFTVLMLVWVYILYRIEKFQVKNWEGMKLRGEQKEIIREIDRLTESERIY